MQAGGTNSSDLRRLIAAAKDDPSVVLDLYRALVEATLHVRSEEGAGGSAAVFKDPHGGFVAFAYLAADDADHLTVPVSARTVFASLGKEGSNLVIDPGGEHEWVLFSHQLPALADGGMFQVDEDTFNGRVYTGVLTEPRGALKAAMRRVLARHRVIRAAFMVQWLDLETTYPPSPAVILWVGGRRSARRLRGVMQECVEAWPERPGDLKAVFAMSPDEALLQYADALTHPFYVRGVRRPSVLSDEALLDFLRSLPDDTGLRLPWWQGLAMSWAASPEVQMSEEEWADEIRKDLRSASTHVAAKRVLIHAVESGEPFDLYLRNSAFETRQETVNPTALGIDFDPRPLVVQTFNVRRPVERLFTELVGAGGPPVVALSNHVDISPAEGILQLEVETSDWIPLMHALVTRARKIYMSFAAVTPGVREELQAIQVHDREDDALLVVSYEPEEQTRPLPGTTPPPELPDPARVRGRLATFGHVVDEDELAELVRHAASAAP